MIYYYHDLQTPLYLILVYAKAQRETMTPDEKKQARALVAMLRPSAPGRKA